MTEEQRLAILQALILLNNVNIPSALVKMYGTADNELFLSLPGIRLLSKDENSKHNEEILSV